MTRLAAHLGALRARGDKALGLFLTSGFPAPDATLPILQAVAPHADFVELGMPFSDPVAEGLPIQQASERALAQGATVEGTLATAAAFTAACPDVPLVLMGYANPVVRYGVEVFCTDAAAAGVAGLILPDLPPEESAELEAAASARGLAVTHLVAPNTPDERIDLVARRSTGFVYAVSVTGLTGSGLADGGATAAYLARARARVADANPALPLLVGFGIATPDDAARLARDADGVIVGSALIRLVERLWDDPGLTEDARLARTSAFAAALKRGAASPALPAPR